MIRSMVLLAVFIAALPTSPSLVASTVSFTNYDRPSEAVPLVIGQLDFDDLADTLTGTRTLSGSYLASAIFWGRSSQQLIDSGASAPLLIATAFQYPEWFDIDGSVTMIDVTGDGVDDLVLSYSGRLNDGHTSSRMLVVFGQNDLHRQPVVDLRSIGPGFQSAPVMTMDARYGASLRNRELRDPTGVFSYQWTTLDLGIAPPPASIAESGERTAWIRLAPNPAVYATTIEMGDLRPGEYFVTIIALDGSIHAEQRVQVDARGSLFRNMDLRSIVSGYYRVMVKSAGRTVGSWPIVVVH